MLRILARNEWKIESTSVQPILQELKNKNFLTVSEWEEAVAKLVLLNYTFVSVNPGVFIWVLAQVGFRLTADVQRVLATFHGPQCTFESAVGVLAEVAKHVWLENIIYEQKIDILDGILDALGKNRPTDQVAEHFLNDMRIKLFFAPNASDAIGKRVRLWKERRLRRAGIIVSARSP